MLGVLPIAFALTVTPAQCAQQISDRLEALRTANGASAIAFTYETEGGAPVTGYLGRHGHEEGSPEAGEQSLFRIYSMTRPITSVAILVLMEQGRISLDDPVAQYLPALAAPDVLARLDGDLVNAPRVDAETPVTLRHLLTHTSGYGYGTLVLGPTPLSPLYDPAGVHPQGGPRDFERLLGQVPLAFQPGEGWAYGMSTDVLGRVIEVVTGQDLGAALDDLVFAPLAMTSTSFVVDAQAVDRLVQPPQGEGAERYFDPMQDPERYSGGMGLVSTLADYARFARMLLNEGELDGVTLLSPETVRMMASNQLAADLMESRWARSPGFLPGPGHGFGFGVRVNLADTGWNARAYGWGGIAGTDFFVAPAAGAFGVLMVQDIPNRALYRAQFRQAILACHADQ